MDDTNIQFKIVADTSQIIKQLDTLEERLKRIRDGGSINIGKGLFDDAGKSLNTFAESYSKTINNLKSQSEAAFKQYLQTGDIKFRDQYKSMIPSIQQLSKEQDLFNKSIKDTNNSMNVLGTSFSKHLGWIATGIGVGSAIGGVIASVHDIAKLETEFNQLKTVLPETEENQATFNQAIKDSFALAEKYGTKIEQVTESLRLMGRGYHELSQSEKLSEIALKLGVADNFDPQLATKSIEAVVGAYGKQSEAVTFATHVMDSMTKVSHTSQISANDLAESLLRSAAAAKTVGVSFDELNAMTAVIARNTGLSGQTIGDGLKSILNSIHSDKAIKDLQSIGVEVYKIGENGQKEFRKITDVLLDVSIKAKSTNQNFEELFRNLSGGKFQVTKLSSLLGDPNEYLRVLGNSINSSGFTDKQLTIQMDTIQRKAQTLKASFEELLMTGGGESGFRNSLKSILDTLNQILKGLNNINPVVWNTIGSITKWTAAFVALRTAVNFATSSYALLRNTIVTVTGAQEALNVATVANPWSALAKLIVLAGSALATYAYFAGEAISAQEKANQAADNAITAKASEIEMTKQQTSYMETLGNTYVSLQDALAKVGDDETKAAEIKRTMGTVSQQLAQIVGKEAADRILASDDIQAAITQEQAVHNEKTNQMQQELDTLRQTQVKLANDTISMCNERIGAINAEAEAFDKAADSIGQALGRIDEIMFKHLRNKANYLNNLANGDIKNEWKIAGIPVPEDQDITPVTDQIAAEAAEANRQADEIKENAINYWAEKGRVALGKIYTPGSYVTTPFSTGTVPESGGGKTHHGNGDTGSRFAPDRQDQIEKLWVNHDVNHMLSESKVLTDNYQESLAKLQLQQDLTGETAELDIKKIALMSYRIKELAQETDNLTKKRDEYSQKANDLIANHNEIADALKEQKLSWNDLTKDEKKDFIHAYLGDTADQKLAINYLEMVDKLTTKIAENNKQSSAITGESLKEQKSSPERLYNLKMQDMNYDKQHEELSLGYNASDEQKRVVELKSAIQELAEAEQRLKEIENSPNHSPEDIKKQQLAIDQLKNKVAELSNYTRDKINEGMEGITNEILLQGNTLRKIWDNLWKNLADDALKALFKIKNNSPGLLSQILGLFGGKSGGSTSVPTVTANDMINGKTNWFAEGGATDKPSIFGEDGEEVAIPVEKNTGNSLSLLKYAAQKLGVGNSNGVVPNLKNPDLAKQPIVNVQVTQQEDHIRELEKQTQVMKSMLQVISSNGGNNGNVVVLPIAPSAESVFEILRSNPDALNNILGGMRSKGFSR